ncbi:MAG: glycoside hydrolase family 38 C-terminal domain-containing protein [Armatimonadota bacterium]|nr:glycoside hydrolase family 38 C-terminal domain-containing protein [Armatimonadota bacterium]
MSDRFPIYVSQHNHFDPLWHRCWDRTFDFRGERFRSYAEVEEHIIDIWLESAKRGVGFVEGQSAVFRKYIERNPHRLDEIRDHVKSGLIQLLAGGEVVSDTNMPSGETLLRNLTLGQRYFEDTFGILPTVGTLEDAFGHSAQIPQLFRGIGCRMLTGISRIRVPGNHWKGLDGSVIFTGDYPSGRHVGHCAKILPCPECAGFGCDQCGNRGLADTCGITDESVWEALQGEYSGPFGIVDIGGEEAVPNPRLPDLIARAKDELGVDVRPGDLAIIEKYFADALAKVDDADLDVSEQVESNPVFAGCYVTRIRVKQELRRVENLVNAAERWATIAHLLGQDYPAEELLEAWRNTVFVGFHDAITSSHMDQPYYELLDMLAEAECEADSVLESSFERVESEIALDPERQYLILYNSESWERNDPVTVSVCNTRGAPMLKASESEVGILDVSATGADVDVTFRVSVPPLGYTVIEAIPDAEPLDSGLVTSGSGSVENEFLRIRVSDRGIDSIFDKRGGKEILDTSAYLANELVLEEDVGDPWGTTKAPGFEERLSRYTTGVRIRRAGNASEIMLTGQYKGADGNTKILSWRQSVMIYKGFDRIDFKTEIDWDTEQRRVRVVFPTNIKTGEGMYSIPYGAVKRSAYEPDIRYDRAINGDWPALNWVDVYSESEDRGVALINTGTPSHKIEDGVIYMSVLRSPTDAWALDEPHYYSCPDFDGARDAGHHEFLYSLIPHAGDYRRANIEKRGREVNNPLICRGLAGQGDGKAALSHSFVRVEATDNVIITALKKADRDDSVVVRLAETGGEPGEALVSIDGADGRASVVELLERNPEPVEGKIALAPFKIVTVKLER